MIITSVIVVNLNGSNYIDKLLSSISKSNSSDYEIIVVDNGSEISEIKSLERIVNRYDRAHLIKLHRNFGPAFARNIGVKNSTGKILSFLDNDTLVHQNWLIEANHYFRQHPKVGLIQCKLLLESNHNKIDYVGEYLGTNGFLVQTAKGGDVDNGQFNTPTKILAAKSAGMFIRRDVFESTGGFDDDYFIYVEETDLGWRTWLSGYEVHYLPSSIVFHHSGTSSLILGQLGVSKLAKFHGPKNYISTLVKNLSFEKLLIILPQHLLLWFGLIFFKIITFNFKDAYYMVSGIGWVIINLPIILNKRKLIQHQRKIKDETLFKHLVVRRSLWYFVSKAVLKSKVGNAQSY